jgi:hypothetical protein
MTRAAAAATLALSMCLSARARAEEPGDSTPKTIEECLEARVIEQTGREYEFFLACCKRLGLGEEACREAWAAQLPEQKVPPGGVKPAPPSDPR